MDCKFCGSIYVVKFGTKSGLQYYWCKSCHRKFAGTDAPPGMRTPTTAIGKAMGLFFSGSSLAEIAKQLSNEDGVGVNSSTVWRWVVRYSRQAGKLLRKVRVSTSPTWVIDETSIRIGGVNMWYWDVLDSESQFLLDTHFSTSHTFRDAVHVLTSAQGHSLTLPQVILSDSLSPYPDAIQTAFGPTSRKIKLQALPHSKGADSIGGFRTAMGDRSKVLKSLKTLEAANIIIDGFVVDYDFLKPHMTMNSQTPAQACGLKPEFNNWVGLVDYLGRVVA